MLAELILGRPVFLGGSDGGLDQLVEIIKVLGTPTPPQIRALNPKYAEFDFPPIKAQPWQKVKASSYLCVGLVISRSNMLHKTLVIAGSGEWMPSLCMTKRVCTG